MQAWRSGASIACALALGLAACRGPNEAVRSGAAGAGAPCGAAVARPHDASKPAWSYHDPEDGPARWGSLEGSATCARGAAQSPVDLVDREAAPGAEPLAFAGWDAAIPVELLDDGHTLEVPYAGARGASDPRITYAGKTYWLAQLHWHSPSEHTIDGKRYAFELHLVHRAADASLAVVAVLFDAGADDPELATLLRDDPGPEKEAKCGDRLRLDALLPASRAFYRYDGSLTTPPCSEGVSWFVLREPLSASAAQQAAYQARFGGPTSRPLQPLGARRVQKGP